MKNKLYKKNFSGEMGRFQKSINTKYGTQNKITKTRFRA